MVRCPRGDRRIDWPAQLAACAVLALLTDALIAAGARSWPHATASGIAAAVAVSVFAALERRSAAPVLHRALLHSRAVRAGLAAGAAVNFALNGSLFVLPLLLHGQHHLSATATGLALLPLTLPFVVNPPLAARIMSRVGSRPPILAGLALLTAGTAVLAWASWVEAGYESLAVGLLLTGLGVSYVLPALASAVVNAVPEETAGAAGGLLNAVRQAGATLGVAAMGALVTPSAGPAPGLLLAALACSAAGLWCALGATSRR